MSNVSRMADYPMYVMLKNRWRYSLPWRSAEKGNTGQHKRVCDMYMQALKR